MLTANYLIDSNVHHFYKQYSNATRVGITVEHLKININVQIEPDDDTEKRRKCALKFWLFLNDKSGFKNGKTVPHFKTTTIWFFN